MDKEIIYKRSRMDILVYLLLCLIGDMGFIYAIGANSLLLGLMGVIVFGGYTIYLIIRLISPNILLQVNKNGIKTKYTKGEYLLWDDISEIYIDNDQYKNQAVDVIAIKMRKENEKNKNIKFSNPKVKVRGDYNINLKYSNGKLEDAYKEIKNFYKNYIK